MGQCITQQLADREVPVVGNKFPSTNIHPTVPRAPEAKDNGEILVDIAHQTDTARWVTHDQEQARVLKDRQDLEKELRAVYEKLELEREQTEQMLERERQNLMRTRDNLQQTLDQDRAKLESERQAFYD